VLDAVPHAHVMAHDESARAGQLIAELAGQPRTRAVRSDASVSNYSREEIARRFASVLDAVTERRGPRGSGERLVMAGK
jgi:hypothetical protein